MLWQSTSSTTTEFDFQKTGLVVSTPRVVGGGGVPQNTVDNLKVVWARSWSAAGSPIEPILLWMPELVLIRYVDDLHANKIAEYLGLVHGFADVMPDPGVDGLMETTALFQGLRRPFHESGMDGDMFAFVMNPPVSFTYENPWQMANREIPVPCARPEFRGLPAVFVTYVKRYESPAQPAGVESVVGEIRGWEWVEADPESPEIPAHSEPGGRYLRRVW